MHLTPAGLPFGMPGIGLLIDGAVQHAPQFGLHSIGVRFLQTIIYTINSHSEPKDLLGRRIQTFVKFLTGFFAALRITAKKLMFLNTLSITPSKSQIADPYF